MLEHWIWLSLRGHLGAKGAERLLAAFGSPEAVFEADRTSLLQSGCVSSAMLPALLDKSLDEAQRIVSDCTKKHIHILTLHDEAYPSSLRAVDDPPTVLYMLGSLPALEERPAIGIVGARSASAYGISAAESIGKGFAQGGGIVVSGLAKGIDAAATRGALSASDNVIAVLGCGVDRIYPRENADLYRALCERGCILSEYPPQTAPLPANFPPRNRIISGLSDGVLIVEAASKSGSLITAERALVQNRDIFAVPGNIGIACHEGSNRLLQQGAYPVLSAQDILNAYEFRYPQLEQVQTKREIPIDIDIPDNYIDLKEIPQDLPEEGRAVMLALGTDTLQMDELIAASGLSASAALCAVTLLEVKGLVQRLAGNRFRRCC